MKNWIIALSILIIPMVAYFVLDKNQVAMTGFEAQAADKALVMKFSSPMCLDCKKMDEVIQTVMPKYADDVMYQSIDAQADNPQTNELIKKYNVTLVPTCVFLKKGGKLYKRTEGFVEPAQFEEYVKGLING